MLLAITSGGRLGNQLMFAANMMASSIEYGIGYKNISFKAEDLFMSCDPGSGAVNCYKRGLDAVMTKYLWRTKKIFGRAPGVLEIIDKPEQAIEEFKKSSGGGYKLFHCWPYLDFYSLYCHQDVIRQNIKPKREYTEEATNVFNSWGIKHKNIIGVHIRQSDYKTWMDGKYYFDTACYVEHMVGALKLLDDCAFIIFSDEKIAKEDLKIIDAPVVFSNQSPVVDMILMSKCSYLIGPPSTFSGWASFMGAVPKYIMIDRNKKITSLKEFGVYMIDLMDNELDLNGNKIISRYSKGFRVD